MLQYKQGETVRQRERATTIYARVKKTYFTHAWFSNSHFIYDVFAKVRRAHFKIKICNNYNNYNVFLVERTHTKSFVCFRKASYCSPFSCQLLLWNFFPSSSSLLLVFFIFLRHFMQLLIIRAFLYLPPLFVNPSTMAAFIIDWLLDFQYVTMTRIKMTSCSLRRDGAHE